MSRDHEDALLAELLAGKAMALYQKLGKPSELREIIELLLIGGLLAGISWLIGYLDGRLRELR